MCFETSDVLVTWVAKTFMKKKTFTVSFLSIFLAHMQMRNTCRKSILLLMSIFLLFLVLFFFKWSSVVNIRLFWVCNWNLYQTKRSDLCTIYRWIWKCRDFSLSKNSWKPSYTYTTIRWGALACNRNFRPSRKRRIEPTDGRTRSLIYRGEVASKKRDSSM